MDRRNFIQLGTMAGLGVTTAGIAACTSPVIDKNADNQTKLPEKFELEEMTIADLQQKLESGEYTSEKLTRLYLDRIAEIDHDGPKLNAVIELNPDALATAGEMDAERKNKKIRGPMHGIPVLIKDNIATGDKMMTTAGSLALDGNVEQSDAFIVKKLRDAGAVIVGKTNLSEWANFRSTRSASGWSSRGGQTKNPCVLNRNPSGSSSGSAAAVAANLCSVAVGTETDGSVIAPSSCCGIVGLKPTVGLLSRSGIIPISATQDTAGPMARTVRDAAILLGALAGSDPADEVTKLADENKKVDYTAFLSKDALKGKRIGIEKSFLAGHEGVTGLYKQAIVTLKALGAEVIEIELLKLTKELGDAEFDVLCYEFKDGVNKYLAASRSPVRSLAGVIDYNRKNESKAMPFFKQELLELCESKGGLDSAEYRQALKKSLSSRTMIEKLMSNNRLDAIAGTSIGLPGCTDPVNGDYDTGFYFCPPAAMAGFPHITVPMGKVHALPVGLSLMAGAWKEAELLGFAYAFEQATLFREAPAFLENLPEPA
ncbi:MAG TPA: amidase [Bacteroidales bacterium]|nr:amidase [Bacteroidales bacterium]